MKTSLEQDKKHSYKLLSDARAKKTGYNSEGTRKAFSDAVTAACPTIKPYDWQLDVAEALTLGLDATIIAGTGSGKTLPWALPLLLDENCDGICLVISPLNELEADHVCREHTDTLGTILITMPSCAGSVLHRETKSTNGGRESRNMEHSRWICTNGMF